MEDFIRILGAVSPVVGWLLMKKDSELPMVTRVARWAALAFAIGYGALLLIEKAKAVL